MKNFERWVHVFLSEKGIDLEETIDVEGPSGLNVIPVGCLVEAMIDAPATERTAIARALMKIDFKNGDVRHYLAHLAKAIAL